MPNKNVDKTIIEYVMRPWSIRGPKRLTEGATVRYEMRVKQLPEFVVSGATDYEVLRAFKRALYTFIESALRLGKEVPLPEGPSVRYAIPARPRRSGTVIGVQTATPITIASVEL